MHDRSKDSPYAHLSKRHRKQIRANDERIRKGRTWILWVLLIAGFTLVGLSSLLKYIVDKNQIDGAAKQALELFADIVRDAGIAFVPIGLFAWFYEKHLRDEIFEKLSLAIVREMPSRYKNMRRSGIVDCYPDLQTHKLKKKLGRLKNCEIRILDLWSEKLHDLVDELCAAVSDQGCTLKVMVLHPGETSTITKRLEYNGSTDDPSKEPDEATRQMLLERGLLNIQRSLDHLRDIRKRLVKSIGEERIGDQLQVRLHRGFVATSLIGFDQTFLVGLYLHGRYSDNGTQLKVCEPGSYFYHELNEHWRIQWEKCSDTDPFASNVDPFNTVFVQRHN